MRVRQLTSARRARRTLALALCLALLFPFCLAEADDTAYTDYAAAVRPDRTGATARQEVSVKAFVDGDTTHFLVPDSVAAGGVLKARYLAVNTPESTGRIEEYGKKAAAFVRERLSAAASILIESDTESWNLDSTGERYLVWVWYKPEEGAAYRNLNIELLQNGLAVGYSAGNNRYGAVCTAAISQAKDQKLNLFSGQKDPDFYYGDAVELTIRELRCHPQQYEGMKVAFHGTVILNYANSVYLEAYDEETGLYFGMPAYYGFGLSGAGLDILSVGNEVRIVGSFQYYEGGGIWQATDLKYRMMKPDDPGNIQKLGDGRAPAYTPIRAAQLQERRMIPGAEGQPAEEYAFAALALSTSVSLQGLRVQSAEETERGVSLLCTQADTPIRVFLALTGAEDARPAAEYVNQLIDVKGLLDQNQEEYQIKVFSPDGIRLQPQ